MNNNYGLILVVLTFVSGIVWLLDSLTLGKSRKLALKQLLATNATPSQDAIDAVAKEPLYLDYAKSFFPILLFIVVLRSFLYEPFQIPSASMKPTLTEGDFILVNKFNYGLRWPVSSEKFADIGLPGRGDVAVFRAPHPPHEDYIKRVIGLPGDTVIYTRDKDLYIIPFCPPELQNQNCPEKFRVKKQLVPGEGYWDVTPKSGAKRLNHEFVETIGDSEHHILNNPQISEMDKGQFTDLVFKVPAKHYFVMGDNRDNSHDGRYWTYTSFVPEENLVGQAVAIWLHLDFEFSNPWISWLPTGVDFGRVGAIR